MDISLLMSEKIEIWVPVEDARVRIRYMSTTDRAEARSRLMVITDDGPRIDISRIDIETCVSAVIGWDGFTVNGEPLEFNETNLRKLARWAKFAEAVNGACFRLDAFKVEEIEEEKKS